MISQANCRLGFITIDARWATGTSPSCYSILITFHLLVSSFQIGVSRANEKTVCFPGYKYVTCVHNCNCTSTLITHSLAKFSVWEQNNYVCNKNRTLFIPSLFPSLAVN